MASEVLVRIRDGDSTMRGTDDDQTTPSSVILRAIWPEQELETLTSQPTGRLGPFQHRDQSHRI